MEVLEIDSNRKTNKFVSAKRHFIKKKALFYGLFLFTGPLLAPFYKFFDILEEASEAIFEFNSLVALSIT